MDITPKYQKPILYSNQPVTTAPFWDDALTFFDAKEYEQSFTATLNYINKDILKGKMVQPGFEKIIYPHGSSEIHIEYVDGQLFFCAPFLKVPEKHKVPVLRKIAELNFTPLTLAQIVYEPTKEMLEFQYRMPIELAQPNKVYDLLREICVYADEYDDEFIKKYQASFYHQPTIEPLTEEDRETAWQQIETYLDDALSYIEYFEAKRWDGYIWDTTADTLMSIVDHAYVNGTLRTDIQEKLWYLRNDKNSDLQRKNKVGKAFLKELKSLPKEEVVADLFLAKKFISTKYRATEKNTIDFLQDASGAIVDDIEAKNYINAFYRLKYAMLNLMYNYSLDTKEWNILTDSLVASAQTSWEDGTKILKSTFDSFTSGDVFKDLTANEPEKKKGFFARLFG